MEYDDNDFIRENSQLNSEEVSKSSPVLSTYSLPKYDFDDSLQGDIRFDSLVETETFLGIESQEDISWIDDFSRGNRIEFGSQDGEPASISRRNNVWSEATSLESVEMLLKSVGQEDIMHQETEVHDCTSVQELESSTMQLTPNEENRGCHYVENVSSGIAFPVDESAQKVLDDNAVTRHPIEDVQYVSSKYFGSGNNVDPLLREVDDGTTPSSVTNDTQAMSKDNNPSVDKDLELNQINSVASVERELQEYVQAPDPLLQAKSQVNCPPTAEHMKCAENLSSELNQGNAIGSPLNQNLQVTGTQEFSEGPLIVSVEGVDDLVLEEEFKSEGHSVENISENVASSDSPDTTSGGEPGTIGTGNNQLKEPYVTPTEETCLGQIDTSGPAEDSNSEFGKHVDIIGCEGSNEILESESAFAGTLSEANNPNSEVSCDDKIHSDALMMGSVSVKNNNTLCASTELNENPEESLEKDDVIGVAGSKENELGGGSEKMMNTLALQKSEKSLTENDEVMGIPGSKMESELVEGSSSPSKECSSAELENVAIATEDCSICMTPPISEEHIPEVFKIPASPSVERDTMEPITCADIIDGNDKCVDTTVQSKSEASSVNGKTCSTGGLMNNDTRVASPVENVYHTQNEGTPCDSPSAIPAADGKDNKESEISPLVVSCGSESKDDAETEKCVQCQFDKSVTACTDDISACLEPKASDASYNDKTFSFIIMTSAEHSKRETVKLWQPFTSQVPVNSQSAKDSPLTPGAEQTNLGNQDRRETTYEQIATGPKSSSLHKPKRASGKTTMVSAKGEGLQKSITPSKLKESNIFPTVESSPSDSNIASSRPSVHLQHFTDLQQLQLRAQIFVYGSLIQGTTPDEACMVAAFGGPDGGRSIWGNARRQCLERIQSQKSQDSNPETPIHQHSSVRTANQKSKTSKSQTKSNAVSRGKVSKSIPVHITTSHLTPPGSPLWTLNTPDRLHFGGMPGKTSLEHNVHPQFYTQSSSSMTSTVARLSTWSPQPAPWVGSPQAATSEASPSLVMRTKMEPVILIPVRESSVSDINVRHSTPGPIAHPIGHNNTIIGGPSLYTGDRTLMIKSDQTLFDSKPSKRKKVELSEASVLIESQLKFEAVSAACVSNILSSSVPTPNSEYKVKTNASSRATVIASSSGNHTANGNVRADDKIMISGDICHKVDEAKLHAEDAAAYSATVVDLCQKMWSQLAKQKDSGVAPDAEAKIASAALAIAAAVAVAKAAAAAAKVASDAATQAKLMAEEAIDSSRIPIVDSSIEISPECLVSNLGNDIPASIQSGENEKKKSGMSLAAYEKTKSAAAALKRAENFNAIVKAAELAAEAVTQAGKVAVMGNPLPLSELANAGPEDCWKLTFVQEPQSNTVIDCPKGGAIEGRANESLSIRETVDVSKNTKDDCSFDIPGDGCKVTSMDIGNNDGKSLVTAENPIKEGSSVEIYKKVDAVKAAWFSANVLELKNGEAYVCYTEKPPTESSGELKEWIKLDIQGNESPKIRAVHPMTAMPTEGARKRRREAMGKCFWSVGDRVDAWRQNCWWEGVITEKSSKDDTAFTVHFSAQGEASVIKACHLRPSLIWQDGKWVEWSISVSNDGDTRKEKRMKLCDPEHAVEGNEKPSENVVPNETKIKGDARSLGLSDNEKIFNVGKRNKDVKKLITHRMTSTGLQNKGKASFGVPKPGKKRKFMDVSEHYVSRDSKTNENNDSARRAKMLIPKGSGLPGRNNSSRIFLHEKKVPATQVKAPNTRKPNAVHETTLDTNCVSSTVSGRDNAFRSQGSSGFAAFSSIGKSRSSPFEFSSFSNEKSSKKILTSTSSKSELSSKTELEPHLHKLGKIEENKVFNSTAGSSNLRGLEPRRSNRRIQPTSRLLEGLQTSLSIPKLPPVRF